MKKYLLKNKNILIGITGSIAAYKICDLIREIKKEGSNITVILTKNAEYFITKTTLQAISCGAVISDTCTESASQMHHVKLSDWADILVVAPATANILGKFSCGIADDLLSTTFLTLLGHVPVIIAPAMNEKMYLNVIVQNNIKNLKGLGVRFVGPQEGELACGYYGKGRLSNISEIKKAIEEAILGRKLKVTYEISNNSRSHKGIS